MSAVKVGVHGASVDKDAVDETLRENGNEPLYTDTRKLGWEFWAAAIVYPCICLAGTIGITTLTTAIFHGLDPISQVCECPINKDDFGPSAVFYTDCNNVNSSWYKAVNGVADNITHTSSGWFGIETKWSRRTLRDKDRKLASSNTDYVPLVYECPVFRPFGKSLSTT